MKFKLVESLEESLHSIMDDAFITDSAYQMRDILVNKPKPYRILYDWNIDSYMFCDANDYIHFDLLKAAFKQGFYLNAEHDESLAPLVREYIADGNEYKTVDGYKGLGIDGNYEDEVIDPYLLYMIYIPTGIDENDVDNSPSSDGYNIETKYSHGIMYFRDPDIGPDKCTLLKLLDGG